MGEAGREFELKFLCDPKDMDAVLAAAPAGPEETRELVSVYYDTPDAALHAAEAAFRVRSGGGRYVQTLKRGKGFSREEHEMEVAGLSPDLSMPALRALAGEDQLAALVPVSEVRITRRQRLVRYAGAEIEIAADVGQVLAGGSSGPISEVELELKSGPQEALFALARELAKAAPLNLSFESKSAQGRALRAT